MVALQKFLCLIVILLMCSCIRENTINNNKVDLTKATSLNVSKLSDVATDIEYIPLQTGDSPIIGRILSIKINEKLICIRTISEDRMSKLFFYNKAGKLMYVLDKTGVGPGEYRYISGFDINSGGTLLAILSDKSIMFYKIEEETIHFDKKLDLEQGPHSVDFIDNTENLLIQFANIEGTNNINRIVMNQNGDTIVKSKNHLKYSLKGWVVSMLSSETTSYEFNNALIIKELQCDTLFRLADKYSFEPYFILDSKDKRLTPEARSDGQYLSNHTGEYIMIRNVLESPGFIYYILACNDEDKGHYYDKKSGKVMIVEHNKGIEDDIAGGIRFNPKYCMDGNFYSWVDAFELKTYISTDDFNKGKVTAPEKKEALKRLGESLNENDNPVIIVAKMK